MALRRGMTEGYRAREAISDGLIGEGNLARTHPYVLIGSQSLRLGHHNDDRRALTKPCSLSSINDGFFGDDGSCLGSQLMKSWLVKTKVNVPLWLWAHTVHCSTQNTIAVVLSSLRSPHILFTTTIADKTLTFTGHYNSIVGQEAALF